MSFTAIEKTAHGDFPLAATINDIISNQSYFNSSMEDVSYGSRGGSRLLFVKSRKFLWFKGSGSIIDFNTPTNTVSISDTDDDYTQYDLSGISWMYEGKIFYVYNCDYAEISDV